MVRSASRFVRGVAALVVAASTALAWLPAGPASGESVAIAVLDPSGALLPDAVVSYRTAGEALAKTGRDRFGQASAPVAGERVQLVVEHPYFGRDTVELAVPAGAGQSVVVRLGRSGARGAFSGGGARARALSPRALPAASSGSLAGSWASVPVVAATAGGCQLPDQLGHGAANTVAIASDSNPLAGSRAAGNFRPLSSGTVAGLCWWGAYIDFSSPAGCGPGGGDAFSVSYYADDAGGLVPGTPFAGPLPVTLTTAFATGNELDTFVGKVDEYQFEGTHAPVAVTGGECHWVELTNATTGECLWMWQTAAPGDGRSAQDTGSGFAPNDFDLAFCVDVATDPAGCTLAAGNDDCADALAISGTGLFPFDNSTATTDGPEHAVCDSFGEQQIEADVWFCWTAPSTGRVRVATCGSLGDTKLALYDGCACPPTDADVIGCDDDSCGLQAAVAADVVAGGEYLIRVGTSPAANGVAAGAAGTLSIAYVTVPANDLCEDAQGPLAVPSTTQGTTTAATAELGLPQCEGIPITSPGVWYSVLGTGSSLTASLCGPGTSFDTKLTVYCGDCAGPLTCVGADDQACGDQSEVTWCTQAGAEYRILVHGFGGESGAFELQVSDDGLPCVATTDCLPSGACCSSLGCVLVSEAGCDALGGVFVGDGAPCGGPSYSGPGTRYARKAFTDIEGLPGAITLDLGDDDGMVVPLGFGFRFFDEGHTTVGIASNGYLSFDATLDAFDNQPIPSQVEPDRLIAPYWDDLDPTAGGSISYVTLGVAPKRIFVAQWKDVPQYGVADANSFQAVLYEVRNRISLRYGSVTPEAYQGDVTIGVEQQVGATGTSFPGADARAGRSFELRLDGYAGPCATPINAERSALEEETRR